MLPPLQAHTAVFILSFVNMNHQLDLTLVHLESIALLGILRLL